MHEALYIVQVGAIWGIAWGVRRNVKDFTGVLWEVSLNQCSKVSKQGLVLWCQSSFGTLNTTRGKKLFEAGLEFYKSFSGTRLDQEIIQFIAAEKAF